MSKNILIVAAHADDEVLGCGGTIAKHAERGDLVYVHFMTNGVGSRKEFQHAIEQRKVASNNAAKLLGIKEIFQHDFPDNQMDSTPLLDIVKSIETTISKVKPEIIYTHFSGDLNVDHQLTHKATMTACRPIIGTTVKEIYSYGVLSSTEWGIGSSFNPNFIVDISATFEKKIEALKMYQQEMRDPPHSRSYRAVEAQDTLLGETHGFKFAEAFMVQRILSR